MSWKENPTNKKNAKKPCKLGYWIPTEGVQ